MDAPTDSAQVDSPPQPSRRGFFLVIAGLVLALLCHVLGMRPLQQLGVERHLLLVAELDYPVPVLDVHPNGEPAGRVVLFGGFGSSTEFYMPLIRTLAYNGYAVRSVDFSGTPNSPTQMRYRSQLKEAVGAAQEFDGDAPLFLMGHSEGTRWALQGAKHVEDVRGVVVLSTISAAAGPESPANVLALVAEHDFDNCKRQTDVLLGIATAEKDAKRGITYGDLAQGTGRLAEEIPDTNHGSIAWNVQTHGKVLAWLDGTTGHATRNSFPGFPPVMYTGLAVGVLAGVVIAVIGLGLAFRTQRPDAEQVAFGGPVIFALMAGGWILGAIVEMNVPFAHRLPLLVYGRILIIVGTAGIVLLLAALVGYKRTAGVPRGNVRARLLLLMITATLLLFDRWFWAVIPTGERLQWFLIAIGISGLYFAADEMIRRGLQRRLDWQTALALGVGVSLVAALGVGMAGFFARPPVGEFLVGGASVVFLLLAVCELPATYLFATTQDWLLSWWVRVIVFNGFLAGVIPLVTESEFRQMI